MKTIFAAAMLTALALVSCRNADDDTLKDLEGSWNWISTTNNAGGVLSNPSTTGKEVVLTLKSDKSYEVKENGAVVNSGTYTVSNFVSNLDHSTKPYIDFSAYPDRLVHSVSNTKLFLRDDTQAGVVDEYDRKP